MVNARDGGVGGVKITYEECETGYNNDKGVECYERLKNKGPTGASLVDPLSTGITYALIERATADKIPVVSMGYGRADASYGAVFPYVFTLPATYWAQADDFIKYVGSQGRRPRQAARARRSRLVYHRQRLRQGADRDARKAGQKYGFTFLKYAGVAAGHRAEGDLAADPPAAPGLGVHVGLGGDELDRDQGRGLGRLPDGSFHRRLVVGLRARCRARRRRRQGLQIRHLPRRRAEFRRDQGHPQIRLRQERRPRPRKDKVGEVLYNRGVINALYDLEAIRTAQDKFGKKPIKGEQVQWGYEHLNITPDRIKALRADGLMRAGASCPAPITRAGRGPHPAMGRQELEVRLRLDPAGPRDA